MHMPLHRSLIAVAFAATTGSSPVWSQDAAQTVVVTGGVRDRQAFDAPYAIGVVDAQALRDAGPLVNLSEALGRVPGLNVSNRNNYAQDLQIS